MTSSPADANNEVHFLLQGVAPERNDQLIGLWQTYAPQFQLLEDDGPAGEFVLEAGLYRLVRFNHRVMRVFWLGAFVAWEGYVSLHKQVVDPDNADFSRFKNMIDTFNRVVTEKDPTAVPLPTGVPEPGGFPPLSDPMRGPAELAVFCVGWALLHELKHIQHQQEGTAAPYNADPVALRAEELSCDEYATKFIMDRVNDYAKNQNSCADLIHSKRAIGIYFALFTITLLSKDGWADTASHPAMQQRIDAIRKNMGPDSVTMADAIAHAAFAAFFTSATAASQGRVSTPSRRGV